MDGMRASHRITITASIAAAATVCVVAIAEAGPPKTPAGTTIECVPVNDTDSLVIVSRGRHFEIFPELVDCTAGIPYTPAD